MRCGTRRPRMQRCRSPELSVGGMKASSEAPSLQGDQPAPVPHPLPLCEADPNGTLSLPLHRYKKNEVFLDVVEKVNLLMSSNGVCTYVTPTLLFWEPQQQMRGAGEGGWRRGCQRGGGGGCGGSRRVMRPHPHLRGVWRWHAAQGACCAVMWPARS